MQIGIISLLSDAFFEDHVIQTLISPELPDLYLEFRAITKADLLRYLAEPRAAGLRRIILHDADVSDGFESIGKTKDLLIVRLTERTSEGIRSEVTRALRNFQSAEETKRVVAKRSNLVVFTGTTGAPGITTAAMNVANEISFERRTTLLDSDPHRNDIAFLLGGKRGEEKIRLSEHLTISSDQIEEEGINIADCGSAPDLNSAISDRRSGARNFSDLLESAAKVVFVIQPENNLVFELERFLDAVRARLVTATPFFLINKLGDTQRQRSILRRCQARIGAGVVLSAPFDLSTLERAKAQYMPIAEVAPRSKLRRSYRDLASLLIQ